MLHALTLPRAFLCALEYVHIHVHWSTCMYVMYVADSIHPFYGVVSGRGLPSCTCTVHVMMYMCMRLYDGIVGIVEHFVAIVLYVYPLYSPQRTA